MFLSGFLTSKLVPQWPCIHSHSIWGTDFLVWQDFKSKRFHTTLGWSCCWWLVTMNYKHPRQGSDRAEWSAWNNSKTRSIWYPTATWQLSAQCSPIVTPSAWLHPYYHECSTVAPLHLNIRSLRPTPNCQITLNPICLVGLCCTTALPKQVQWPSLGSNLPALSQTSSDDCIFQTLLGYKPLQSIKCIKLITLCATHRAVYSFLTLWQQHLASFLPAIDHTLHVCAHL